MFCQIKKLIIDLTIFIFITEKKKSEIKTSVLYLISHNF